MGNPGLKLPTQAPAYRDEPDHAETASMSSAVLMDEMDFPEDEDLPGYTDTAASQSNALLYMSGPGGVNHGLYLPPPELPFSSRDWEYKETRTRFPNYTTSSTDLYKMLKEQSRYPPTYFVLLHGTHTETRRQNGKETKDKVRDFYFKINITYLLGRIGTGDVELLPDNKRGYRGTRIPRRSPTVSSDLEEGAGRMDELLAWCERYVEDKSGWKSFTLKKKVVNHDTKRLEQLLRSAIAATHYRGHLHIAFPKQHETITIYSPGKVNEWRITQWVRILFYWTFLWVFAWPTLFLLTARYEVLSIIWEHADHESSAQVNRQVKVMSELDWFHRWESTIRRSAIERKACGDFVLDEAYRDACLVLDERDARREAQPQASPNNTGSAFVDGALGFLGGVARIAGDYNDRRGWGGDN